MSRTPRNRLSHEALLHAVSEALRVLLEPGDWSRSIQRALRIVGEACAVDRVYIFENSRSESTGELLTSQRFEWTRDGIDAQINNPELQNLPYFKRFSRWEQILQTGQPIFGRSIDCPSEEAVFLQEQQILSFAVVPIRPWSEFWGFIGFDDCSEERDWSEADLDALETVAAGIGNAMLRMQIERNYENALAALRRQTEDLSNSRRVALSLIEDAKLAESKASAANAAKSKFLAMMSHEMRTPLNAILGFTELSLSENPPEPISDYIRTIQSSGHLLLNLINDVLDLAKIEAGGLEVERTPSSIRQVAKSVIQSTEKLASAKKLTLKLNISNQVPDTLIFDPTRFGQILLNLVGNAIKFTDAGEIRVSISGDPIGELGFTISGSVSDTGIGIADDALERIFNPFGQAHSSVHRRFGGTGLGLPISRQLCRLLGGELEVESEPGMGSTFRFSFDATITDKAPVTANSNHSDLSPIPSGDPIKILVVDDVATNRRLISTIFGKMGCTATLAASGEDALVCVHNESYNIIFMDVLMPGIDGCETTARIREFEKTANRSPKAKIIGLSADAMHENRQRCLDSGMDGFLTKPIKVPALREILMEITATNIQEP